MSARPDIDLDALDDETEPGEDEHSSNGWQPVGAGTLSADASLLVQMREARDAAVGERVLELPLPDWPELDDGRRLLVRYRGLAWEQMRHIAKRNAKFGEASLQEACDGLIAAHVGFAIGTGRDASTPLGDDDGVPWGFDERTCAALHVEPKTQGARAALIAIYHGLEFGVVMHWAEYQRWLSGRRDESLENLLGEP